MRIDAPAKINLSLEVLGRRPDGYHDIRTLMVPISLADTLEFTEADRGELRFSCDDATIPGDDSNLVVKAARAFYAAAAIQPSVAIRLEKKIPHGAGLGGGSSDAASTLLGLNAMHGNPIDSSHLAALAASIGSDVPFFMVGGPAWCQGRGEMVSPAPFRERLHLLLLKPPFGVPTPWAYSRWLDAQEIPDVPYRRQRFTWGELVNDLERPVFEKYLLLADIKRWLMERPETAGALMSGSGATVFAVLTDAGLADDLAEAAKAEFGETLWTCATWTSEK